MKRDRIDMDGTRIKNLFGRFGIFLFLLQSFMLFLCPIPVRVFHKISRIFENSKAKIIFLEGKMFNKVCSKLIERMKIIAATHDISVAMVLNDFISYANRRRPSLKYLTDQEFRFLYSVLDNANPKCKNFILENPDIVYYKYKKDG